MCLDQNLAVAYKGSYASGLGVCGVEDGSPAVLVLASRNGTAVQGSTTVIIEQGTDRFAVIITGMGTRNAEAKADAVLGLPAPAAGSGPPVAEKPDAVLVIGLCGGLTERLPEDRIVAYTECLSTGTNKAPPLQCSPVLTEGIVRRLQQHGITVDRVIGITSPEFLTASMNFLENDGNEKRASELISGEGDSVAVPSPNTIPCWEMPGSHNEKARKCAHQNEYKIGTT